MKRREFSLTLAAGAALFGPAPALAQGGPAEGRDYVRLERPVAVPSGGKIDVIEFFWYGCPHCNQLEPLLEAWVRKLPADVAFRRIHVAFTAVHEAHARLYYALEVLGKVEVLHRKVFAAIHLQHQRLDKDADIAAFLAANGIDRAQALDTLKSFGVVTKVRQAKQIVDAYKIDGVPAFGVHGRWFTSGALAGPGERTLAVVSALIERARAGR